MQLKCPDAQQPETAKRQDCIDWLRNSLLRVSDTLKSEFGADMA